MAAHRMLTDRGVVELGHTKCRTGTVLGSQVTAGYSKMRPPMPQI